MGVLPQIEYGGPVQGNPAAALPGQAVGKFADTLSSFLAASVQNQVKVETLGATADLQERLNNITLDIQRDRSISAEKVRGILGENIPAHVAKQMTREVPDPTTGAMKQVDNDAVPMNVVAGAIYDVQAKQAVKAASSQITIPGWAASFEDHAAQHVEQRKMVIAELQLKAMHDGQVASTWDHIKKLVNAGDFDTAAEGTRTSTVLDPKMKVEAFAFIENGRELRPVQDAMRSNDPMAIQEQINRLNGIPPADPKKAIGIENIDPAHRTQFVHAMTGQLHAIKVEQDKAVEAGYKKRYDAAQGALARVELISKGTGLPPSPAQVWSIVAKAAPGLHGDDFKTLNAYGKLLTSGEDRKTDLALYQQLEFWVADNPEAFKKDEVVVQDPGTGKYYTGKLLDFAGQLSEGDFKKFANIQGALNKEGRDSAAFADHSAPVLYMKVKLESDYGFDTAKPSDDQRQAMGRATLMIRSEITTATIAAKRRLNSLETDKIVDDVLAREIKYTPHWYGDSIKFKQAGVPIDLAVAISTGYRRRLNEEELIKRAKDFQWYEPGIEKAWNELAPNKPMTTEKMVQVYSFMATRWNEIDRELSQADQLPYGPPKLSGQMGLDPTLERNLAGKRTAIAVKSWLKTPAGMAR